MATFELAFAKTVVGLTGTGQATEQANEDPSEEPGDGAMACTSGIDEGLGGVMVTKERPSFLDCSSFNIY